MNVLLLALSTISGENLKCFEYQYGEGPCFDGYYQLEPIPKFLNEKLKENHQSLDCIITLNTCEVDNAILPRVRCIKEDVEQYSFTDINAKGFFEKMLCNGQKAFQKIPKIISIPIELTHSYECGLFFIKPSSLLHLILS